MTGGRKEHWEQVYRKKRSDKMSWWQEVPRTSLDLVRSLDIGRDARIIDAGGGDARLVDCLLDEGYQNLTVLDISEEAIARARERLGGKGAGIRWIAGDITNFHAQDEFEVWHDRAAFHFLTDEDLITRYVEIAGKAIVPGGYLIIGTFSDTGPLSCSGLPVRRYSEGELLSAFGTRFDLIDSLKEDHPTPSKVMQNFIFCRFRKRH